MVNPNQLPEIMDHEMDDMPFMSKEPPVRRIVDEEVYNDHRAMTTGGQILSNIQIISRLETSKPSAADIVLMIQKAKEVRDLADILVEEMQEHRLKILRDLGVDL